MKSMPLPVALPAVPDDARSAAALPTAALTAIDAATLPAIRLEGVSKSFRLPNGRTFEAVKRVSLTVPSGEIYGLIGTSGAGKSTLLRLINRLEHPDSGR